jgi:hypothetical protein
MPKPDSQRMKQAIQSVIITMMDRVLHNVLVKDPFLADIHRAKKPLYAALVPDEIFKAAHFERRFVTPFGSVWEKLAVVAAQEGLGHAQTAYTITGVVAEDRLRRITEILNRLEHQPIEDQQRGEKRTRPDWNSELAYVLQGKGHPIPVTVVCDFYAEGTSRNQRYAFELKAPLPNSDQSKVSKEKILKLYAMQPCLIDNAYFALPYNPYGKRENYSWSFPARWFDMQKDAVVLIGDEFWEIIGGAGTYQAFIEAVNEIGGSYRERIYREFLGIEPPIGHTLPL